MGWPTGLEPATTRTTIWGSTIELRPPSSVTGHQILKSKSSFAKQSGSIWLAFWHAPRLPRFRVEGWIATGRGRITMPPRLGMKSIGSILVAGLFLLVASPRLPAQADDPSEIFLKAYMAAQQGEKLEHENQLNAGLAKYRFAGSLIEELRKHHTDWQPAIVEYRGRKISESILRLQGKAATEKDLAATAPSPETPETTEEVTRTNATPPNLETAPQKPTNPTKIVEAPP